MLLMVGKGVSGATFHATHQHIKSNNKYMKYYSKNGECLYFKY